MLVPQPNYRRPLNLNQLKILSLCYKFRFVSAELIARLQKKDRSTIYESLYVLEKQDYVVKRYDSSYKLRGQPASYCLSAKGIRYLLNQDPDDYDFSSLRNFYRNPSMPDEKITMCMWVFELFLILKDHTNEQFSIYTQYELDRSEYPYPQPLLKLENENENMPDYILDCIEAFTPSWRIRKRIEQHEKKAEECDYIYPNVLFIAGNESTERRLFKLTAERYQDFDYSVTQLNMLMSSKDGQIWIDEDESDDDEFIRKTLLPKNEKQ